jgi:hypothetical protein
MPSSRGTKRKERNVPRRKWPDVRRRISKEPGSFPSINPTSSCIGYSAARPRERQSPDWRFCGRRPPWECGSLPVLPAPSAAEGSEAEGLPLSLRAKPAAPMTGGLAWPVPPYVVIPPALSAVEGTERRLRRGTSPCFPQCITPTPKPETRNLLSHPQFQIPPGRRRLR